MDKKLLLSEPWDHYPNELIETLKNEGWNLLGRSEGSEFRLLPPSSSETEEDSLKIFLNELPCGLIELDMSEVKKYLEHLYPDGNISFWDDGEDKNLRECLSFMHPVYINNTALSIYETDRTHTFKENFNEYFTVETLKLFKIFISETFRGKTCFTGKSVDRTLTGKNVHVYKRAFIPPEAEQNWNRVLISVMDISELKDAYTGMVSLNKKLEKLIVEKNEQWEISEAHYHSLVASLPGAALRCNLDENLTLDYISDQITELTGYRADELVQNRVKSFRDLIYEDDLPLISQTLVHKIIHKSSFSENIRLIHKDGSLCWVNFIANPVFKEKETLEFINGILLDITEQKKSDEKLRLREEQFRGAFESGIHGMVITSREGALLRINQAFAEMTGYSVEELKNMTFSDITPTEDLNQDLDLLNELVSGLRNNFQIIKRYRHKEGHLVWAHLSVSLVRDEDKNPLFFMGQTIDITAKKRAEEAFKISELRYKTLFDTLAQGVIYHDNQGRIFSVNPAAERIVGKKAVAFQQNHPFEIPGNLTFEDGTICTPEQYPAAIAFSKGTPVDFQTFGIFNSNDNKKHWVTVTAIPLFDKNSDTPYQVYTTLEDITVQKEMEHALKKSEEQFRAIFESTRDCILIFDKDYNYLFANKAVVKDIHTTRERVIGKNIQDGLECTPRFIHLWKDLWIHRINKVFQTKEELRIEDVNRIQGRTVYSETTLTPLWDVEGDVFAVGMVYRDITERKESENALEASEQRLKKAVLDAPFPIMIHAEDGEVILLNHSWSEITGYDVILTFSDWTEMAFGARLPMANETVESIYGITDRVHEGEFTIHTFFGEKRKWDMSSAPLGTLTDGRRAIITMAVDITERKKTEEISDSVLKVLETMEKLSPNNLMSYALEECIKLTDSHIGFFHLINPDQETIQLVTWSSETLDQCHVKKTTTHYPISQAGIWVDAFYERRPVIHNDYSITTRKNELPKGHCPLLRDLTIPIIEGDKVTGILGVGNKNTEYTQNDVNQASIFINNIWTLIQRKKLEDELIKARKSAEAASQAKSDFLSSMSHEIRTPMNAIIGMAEALSGTPLNSEQKGYVDLFSSASENLLEIINNILDISKIEAGQMTLETIPFDLSLVAEQTCDLMAFKAAEKNLKLILHIEEGITMVYGDPYRLKQILNNLISNAVKYTSRGHILIKIREESLINDRAIYHIQVEDTGIGIPLKKQSHIFDTFTQVDSSITRKYGGTGLGLNIVKRLTSMMNGLIRVRTNRYKGCTFEVMLPFRLGDPLVQEPFQGDPVEVLAWLTDSLDRSIITEYMQNWCCSSLVYALSKENFLKQLTNGNNYSLIITDELNEKDCLSLLKEMNTASPLTCIVLTNKNQHLTPESKQVKYITRPIKKGELRNRISEIILTEEPEHSETDVKKARVSSLMKEARILLAEDSRANQIVIQAFLKEFPLTIDIAENGETAFELFKSNTYNLVLMDVQMPVLDGYSATEKIRAWEKEHSLQATPVIALTANAFKEDKEKSLSHGCSEHLAKPLRQSDLIETLCRYLPDEESYQKSNTESYTVEVDPILLDLIPSFLETVREYIEEIQKSIEQEVWDKAAGTAHRLKGEGGTYGLNELSRYGALLEEASKKHSKSDVLNHLTFLIHYLDNLKAV